MKNVELLWELQQIENKIIEINKDVGILDLERDIDNSTSNYNKLLALIKTKAKKYKEKDFLLNKIKEEIKTTLNNIEVSEERLYGGEVNKAKAINQLQREINDNKKKLEEKNQSLTDLRKENINNIKHIKLWKSKLEHLKSNIDQLSNKLREKRKETSSDLKTINKRIEQIKSMLLPEEIDFYYEKKDSLYPVIVAYTGDSCEGCKMQFSLIFIQNIENNDLRMSTCENCGRLIYIPKTEKVEA